MKITILFLLGILQEATACERRKSKSDDLQVTALKVTCSGCDVERISTFKNWAKTETRKNVIKVSPRTKDELSNIIIKAKELRLTMRVTGTRHSWSPLFPDSGNVALDLRQLQCHDGPQIEKVEVDGTPAIRVMSGLTIKQLVDFQVATNFSIESNTIFTVPTVGGVFSAGCHGAAVHQGPVADYLLKVRLMDSSGRLREFSKVGDATVFPALQTSLGLAGVLYDLTIAVKPTRVFRRENLFMTVSDLTAAKIAELAGSSHSLHVFYFPFNSISTNGALKTLFTGKVTSSDWNPMDDSLWIVKITEENTETVPEGKTPSYMPTPDDVFQSKALDVTDGILAFSPRRTPLLTRSYLRILKEYQGGKTYIEYTPDTVHWRPLAETNPILETEWFLPTDTSHTQSYEAFQYTVEKIRTFACDGKFPINLAIEFRFNQGAQHTLGPGIVASSPDLVMALGALSVLKTRHFEEFADDLAAYARTAGGCPHWAKLWSGGRETISHIRTSYNIGSFKAALSSAGLDPRHFSNSALRDVFGLDE